MFLLLTNYFFLLLLLKIEIIFYVFIKNWDNFFILLLEIG